MTSFGSLRSDPGGVIVSVSRVRHTIAMIMVRGEKWILITHHKKKPSDKRLGIGWRST